MDEDTRKFSSESEQPTRRLDETPTSRPKTPRMCAKCGGEQIVVDVKVPGATGRIDVKRPEVWTGFLSGGVSEIGAFACTNCGFIEFYALYPEELRRGE